MRTATDDAAVADLYPAAPAPPGAGMEGRPRRPQPPAWTFSYFGSSQQRNSDEV